MFSANAVWPSTERCTREVLYLFLRNPKPRNAFGYRFEQFLSMLRSCLPNVYPEFDSYTLHFKNSWLNRFRISFKGKRQWSYNVIQITSYHLKQCNTIQYNATQRNATQRNAILFKAIQYIDDSLMGFVQKLSFANCPFFITILVNILPVWTSPKTGLLVITVACLTAVSSVLFSDTIDSFVTNTGRNTCDALVWSFISSKCTSIRVRSLSTRPNPSILILPKGKVPVIY